MPNNTKIKSCEYCDQEREEPQRVKDVFTSHRIKPEMPRFVVGILFSIFAVVTLGILLLAMRDAGYINFTSEVLHHSYFNLASFLASLAVLMPALYRT